FPSDSTADPRERLANGNLDMVSCAIQKPEPLPTVNFSEPYLSMPVVIISRDEAPFLVGLGGLEGHAVAVPVQCTAAEWLQKATPRTTVVNPSPALHALPTASRGDVVAAIANLA